MSMDGEARDAASTETQCEHDLPMLFDYPNDYPKDGYYACCRRCGKLGPVRDTPQSAWDSLLNEE